VIPLKGALPVLLKVTSCAALGVPTAWLGKLNDAGDTAATARGAAVTVTAAEPAAVPPLPLQVSVYVSTPTLVGAIWAVPLTPCAPLQAPLAVHDVASVDDQLNVAPAPTTMLAGVAVTLTVGAAGSVPDCAAGDLAAAAGETPTESEHPPMRIAQATPSSQCRMSGNFAIDTSTPGWFVRRVAHLLLQCRYCSAMPFQRAARATPLFIEDLHGGRLFCDKRQALAGYRGGWNSDAISPRTPVT
jgi:hypothetical protein